MTRKIKIASILLFCLCLGLLITSCGKKEENNPSNESSNFQFQLNEDKMSYSVSAKKGEKYTNIVIPSTYKNTPVTTIAKDAFEDCTTLTSVTIPDSITTIESYAFSDCKAFTNLIMSKSVKSIKYDVFSNCILLSNVFYEGTIEDWCEIEFSTDASNPMYYGTHFFLRNNEDSWGEVTTLKIPTIEVIKSYQFYGFNNVTTIVIPKSVKEIEYMAFNIGDNPIEVFYEGSLIDWYLSVVLGYNYDISHSKMYYYSGTKPTQEETQVASYWHYVNDKITKW